MQKAAKPTCKCGHDRDNFWVSPKAQYPTWNFLMGIFMGLSMGLPRSVKFVCRQCDAVVEESKDPDTIKRFSQR
ncbi:MAG: hypothetical protein AAF564_08415 [Bacteroidota bacterium]